jgi:hypothetical protein
MEEQIPPSQPPMQQTLEGQITPEMLAEMKARAMELAIQQTVPQRLPMETPLEAPPQVVYVRRNLTVAELLLVLLLSCGIVTGIQGLWYLGTNLLPRLEIRVR